MDKNITAIVYMKLYDIKGKEFDLPETKDFEIIENSNGDIFYKHPNGILEVYFRRSLKFTKVNTIGNSTLLVSTNIDIPSDVQFVKGISIFGQCSAAGLDVSIVGLHFDKFIESAISYIPTLYILYESSIENVDKEILFHVTGKWK